MVEMEMIADDGLTDLRHMVKEMDDEMVCDTSDEFLSRFLRHKRFNVKAAFESIQKYYYIRKELPKKMWPRGKGIKWMEPFVALNNCTVFPRKNPRDNTRIFAWRKGLWKPEEKAYELADSLTWSLYMIDYLLFMRTDAGDDGWTSIMDMSGFGARHVPHCDLRVVRTYANLLKGALPLRVKAIHFVNVPSVFHYVLKLIKFLLEENLRDRIFVHSSAKGLTETIDASVLPKEYGGTEMEFSSKWLFDEMLLREQEFVARSYHGFKN